MLLIMGDNNDPLEGTRVPRAARAALNRLLANKQISPDALRWLIVATDPFHDTDVKPMGFPDACTTRSDVQVITYTAAISTPLDDDTPWDMTVWLAPLTPCFTQNGALKTAKPPSKPRRKETPKKDDEDGETQKTVRTDSKKKLVPETGKKETSKNDPVELKKRANLARKTANSIVDTRYFRTTVDKFGTLNQTGSGIPVYAGWNVSAVANGDDWETASDGASYGDVSIQTTFCSGAYRLIATGCEVVNTTAQLYRGGSVTVVRSPSITPTATLFGDYDTGGGSIPLAVNARGVGMLPPSNQPDAAMYPTSKTWDAEKGVYMVGALNSTENPYYQPLPGFAGLVTPTSETQLEDGAGWIGYFPDMSGAASTGTALASSLSSTLPYDSSVAIFTGLNSNSVMQVTARYYFERHPTSADPDLLTLSKTPCPYDPLCLEIYSRCMNDLPVGTFVKNNPFGEWFTEVCEFFADWAPKIGGALGNLGIPMVKYVGKGIGSLASQYVSKQRKQITGDVKPLIKAEEKALVAIANTKQKKKGNKSNSAVAKAVEKKKKKKEKKMLEKAFKAINKQT